VTDGSSLKGKRSLPSATAFARLFTCLASVVARVGTCANGFELTFAPTEDAMALHYLTATMETIRLGKPIELCNTVSAAMNVSYQYTSAAEERCRGCFKPVR